MKKVIFPIVSLLCFIISCQQPKKQTQDELIKTASQSKTINVGKNNYAFIVPSGWKSLDTIKSGVHLHQLTSPKNEEGDMACFNIINESMSGHSFDEYFSKAIADLNTTMPDLNIIDEGEIDSMGLKKHWMHYTATLNGNKWELVVYIIPKNGVAYVLTGGSKPGTFKRYRSSFDKIAKSFHFVD